MSTRDQLKQEGWEQEGQWVCSQGGKGSRWHCLWQGESHWKGAWELEQGLKEPRVGEGAYERLLPVLGPQVFMRSRRQVLSRPWHSAW